MSAGFGSWLFSMSLGASALGGMLGMASGIFILLAATTFASALLYTISGFGFAVVAAPLFLLFLDPARAIQLVIIISTALSIIVLRGLLPAIAPWLLLRLALGSLVRAAARLCRLPLCRSDPGAGNRRGDDLWLRHIDGGLAPPVG